MQILIKLSEVCQNDTVLDVACGPGMVACEFAKHAGHVTGIDITPAMIEQAEKRQNELKLENLAWTVGDAIPLPYADNSFSLVITRYSFHHLLAPEMALAEMIRVCRPGGLVMVADVAMDPSKSEAYDCLEIMRDPSHTHALTLEEFSTIFHNSGLHDCHQSAYGVDIELETQIKASFPNPGDEPKLRDMVTNDVGIDNLGINARMEDNKVMHKEGARVRSTDFKKYIATGLVSKFQKEELMIFQPAARPAQKTGRSALRPFRDPMSR